MNVIPDAARDGEIAFMRSMIEFQQTELREAYRQLHRYAEDFRMLLVVSHDESEQRLVASADAPASERGDAIAAGDAPCVKLELGELCAELAQACGQGERYCEALRQAARASDYWGRSDVALSTERDICQSEIACFRHERFNGSGFPDRLEGGDIPLSARIFALVAFVISLSKGELGKCNEIALSYQEMQEMLRRLSDGVFDPDLVGRLLPILGRMSDGGKGVL